MWCRASFDAHLGVVRLNSLWCDQFVGNWEQSQRCIRRIGCRARLLTLGGGKARGFQPGLRNFWERLESGLFQRAFMHASGLKWHRLNGLNLPRLLSTFLEWKVRTNRNLCSEHVPIGRLGPWLSQRSYWNDRLTSRWLRFGWAEDGRQFLRVVGLWIEP